MHSSMNIDLICRHEQDGVLTVINHMHFPFMIETQRFLIFAYHPYNRKSLILSIPIGVISISKRMQEKKHVLTLFILDIRVKGYFGNQ